MLVCSSSLVNLRSSEIALCLVSVHLRDSCRGLGAECRRTVMGIIWELQRHCDISSERAEPALAQVAALLELYEQDSQIRHRQSLVWKLSNRTLRQLRPTDRLRRALPSIWEESLDSRPDRDSDTLSVCNRRGRVRTDSVSSLESELRETNMDEESGEEESVEKFCSFMQVKYRVIQHSLIE